MSDIFRQYVNRPVLFLEIGTGNGGSALMWKRYFGPMARIVTLDIEDRRHIEEEQIFVRTGDQGDPSFLTKVIEEFGAPDIVFDDGSHLMKHVNASFDVLYPLMSPNGIYLVEDMSTAYWPEAWWRISGADFVCRTLQRSGRRTERAAESWGGFGNRFWPLRFFNRILRHADRDREDALHQ